MNVFELQSPDEIEELYIKFNKELLKNNDKYFHFPEAKLKKYLRKPNNSNKYRFNKFQRNWENFNNHKQLLFHFFKNNKLPKYPEIFNKAQRISIKTVHINFNDILEEVNILRIQNKTIPYTYKKILESLIKNIFNKYILKDSAIRIIKYRY